MMTKSPRFDLTDYSPECMANTLHGLIIALNGLDEALVPKDRLTIAQSAILDVAERLALEVAEALEVTPAVKRVIRQAA